MKDKGQKKRQIIVDTRDIGKFTQMDQNLIVELEIKLQYSLIFNVPSTEQELLLDKLFNITQTVLNAFEKIYN